MGIFREKKEDKGAESESGKKEAEKTPPVAEVEKKNSAAPANKLFGLAAEALIEPWVTEKSHEKMAENKYVFKVAKKAGKNEIERAVEGLYGVSVVKTNIINIPAKKRKFGSRSGWKSGYKKALVTLKAGDKIELFEGV